MRVASGRVGGGRGGFGQAEVEKLDAAIPGDEDVIRLEIAVYDLNGMRGGQPAGDLYGQIEQLARAVDGCKRQAVYKLHHQIARGFGRCPNVIDLADVGMVQRRHGARLAFESLRERRLRDFDSDDAVKTGIPGLEYFPHSAHADGRKNLIGSQAGSGVQGHQFETIVPRECTARATQDIQCCCGPGREDLM